jgi:hypothetical protein
MYHCPQPYLYYKLDTEVIEMRFFLIAMRSFYLTQIVKQDCTFEGATFAVTLLCYVDVNFI